MGGQIEFKHPTNDEVDSVLAGVGVSQDKLKAMANLHAKAQLKDIEERLGAPCPAPEYAESLISIGFESGFGSCAMMVQNLKERGGKPAGVAWPTAPLSYRRRERRRPRR